MALGKGLGALITSTSSKRSTSKQTTKKATDLDQDKLWYIPVTSISSNAKQPRQVFKDKELKELADSIKVHGILQPLVLTETADGGYEIVAGERRWRAAKLAGLAVVPALVKEIDDHGKLEVALIENIQREDLNPLEEAFAFKRLVDEFGLSQKEVAAKVGKAPSTIANSIRLLELPEEIKKALADSKVSMGQARALLGLPSKDQQLEMLASMLGQKITVREVERQVGSKSKNKSRRDPNLVYLEDELRGALGTKVSITKRGEKGKIIIEYFSREELEQLIKKLS